MPELSVQKTLTSWRSHCLQDFHEVQAVVIPKLFSHIFQFPNYFLAGRQKKWELSCVTLGKS